MSREACFLAFLSTCSTQLRGCYDNESCLPKWEVYILMLASPDSGRGSHLALVNKIPPLYIF